jgi:glycosyltransferase involved in cell wall biosynthesis
MKNKHNISISVIVPVYNEEDLIDEAVRKIHAFLAGAFNDLEIIVVESGSTDRTPEIVDALASELHSTRVYHQERREGMGSAVRLAYTKCTKELIWKIVPDLPFALDNIHTAMPFFPSHDFVHSYRYPDASSAGRRVMSWGFNLLATIVVGVKLRCVNSSFNVFKRSVVQNVEIISNGWFYQAELLAELGRSNLKFTEIPVAVLPRMAGTSTVSVKTAFGILREMRDYLGKRFRKKRRTAYTNQ